MLKEALDAANQSDVIIAVLGESAEMSRWIVQQNKPLEIPAIQRDFCAKALLVKQKNLLL